jgi:hypothetical protein
VGGLTKKLVWRWAEEGERGTEQFFLAFPLESHKIMKLKYWNNRFHRN